MTQKANNRGFIGALWFAGSRSANDRLISKFADSHFTKSIQLPGSRGAIALWGTDLESEFASEGDLFALSLGEPRFTREIRQDNSTGSQAASWLAAYRQSGTAAFEAMGGNFAVALFDLSRNFLFLAIDRIGLRQLFYLRVAGGVLFSTDLDCLQAYSPVGLSLNRQAIYGYSYFHTVPSPLTIYAEVQKLPPAHKIRFTKDSEQTERYWHPNFAERRSMHDRDLPKELIRRLRVSVDRLTNGPDTGAFLSGGLDSSTVAGMLSEILEAPARSISVGFDVEGYDEIHYARIAAEHFGLSHHVHYMTPDEIADAIPVIANGYSEPFGNSSAIPSYLCAVAAKKQGIETILAGDGGDELYAGNTRYAKQTLFEYYLRIPNLIRHSLLEPLFGSRDRSWRAAPLRKLHRYIQQAKTPLPERLQTFNLLEMRGAESIFAEDFLESVDTAHPAKLLEAEYNLPKNGDALDRMLYSDWRFTLADNDLRKVIRTCELAGIDVRFPFLDDDVVEFSTLVPSDLKLRRLQLRYFYKRALSDFLPKEIINKSKHGFGLPFGEWLRTHGRLQEMVYDALNSLEQRHIYRRDFIAELIDDHREGHAAFYGNMVWVLAMLEWWLAAHSSNFEAARDI